VELLGDALELGRLHPEQPRRVEHAKVEVAHVGLVEVGVLRQRDTATIKQNATRAPRREKAQGWRGALYWGDKVGVRVKAKGWPNRRERCVPIHPLK